MIEPIRTSWRRWRRDRKFRRDMADLPDHFLRDVGLERDRVGPRALGHVLRPGQ